MKPVRIVSIIDNSCSNNKSCKISKFTAGHHYHWFKTGGGGIKTLVQTGGMTTIGSNREIYCNKHPWWTNGCPVYWLMHVCATRLRYINLVGIYNRAIVLWILQKIRVNGWIVVLISLCQRISINNGFIGLHIRRWPESWVFLVFLLAADITRSR